MNTTQLPAALSVSDLIPVSVLILLTITWVIIFLHFLKIYHIILQTNQTIKNCITLKMTAIKLERRDLEERRDLDYINEPMKLLKFSYSCLIPKEFHPIPKPNINFKLIWECQCDYTLSPITQTGSALAQKHQ